MNRREFIKSTSIGLPMTAIAPLAAQPALPKSYHKLVKDWSFSCPSVKHWNNMSVYSVVGLRKKIPPWGQVCLEDEYILRTSKPGFDIYVDGCRHYRIGNVSTSLIGSEPKMLEAKFDILEFLGPTPTERIVILPDPDGCIYALGNTVWIPSKPQSPYSTSWSPSYHVRAPLTEAMHAKIQYWGRKRTYAQYLEEYRRKIKELGLDSCAKDAIG